MYKDEFNLTSDMILEKDFKIDTRGYRLKEVVLEIKKKENVIPTVPYLHEIIKENNNFSLKVEKNSCHNKKNIIY